MRHFGTACLGLALGLGALACGGGGGDAQPTQTARDVSAGQVDADPMALLPAGAIGVFNVDARAFYGSASLGSQLSQVTERVLPIGEEAGFVASRDLDRVLLGSYSLQGLDLIGVLKGRFDDKKIAAAAQNRTPTKGGQLIVASTYAGRVLYTVNNAGFTVLSPATVLVGTETGMRRALDRMRDGAVKRDTPAWMISTLETPNAAFAVAADFVTQPLAAVSVGALPLAWLKNLQMVRVIGNFHEPGMNIAGSLTYPDPSQAEAASGGLGKAFSMVNVLAATGVLPTLRNVQVGPKDADVQCAFVVDDQALRTFLSQLPAVLGSG
jgi:hypothetical protein